MGHICAYVKLFEKKEYAKDFVAGKLYMNTIRSFKEYRDESGELRGDPYEGIIALYQPSQLDQITWNGLSIPASDLATPIVVHSQDLLNHNVFCIYALHIKDDTLVSADTLAEFKQTLALHESCFGLGKFCVVITNAAEFQKRCKQAIEKLGLGGTMGMVEYFDENTFHGKLDDKNLGYQKRNMFFHQHEYRIKINRHDPISGPFTLKIEDLSDIAQITTPQEFNEELELRLPDGSRA